VISVIIVTWNSSQEIGACLESVLKQRSQTDEEIEIIIVDNNSQDNTVQLIENHFSEVRLVKNPKNMGYAYANNQGIRIARGQYLLLLNPDATLADNFFSPLVDFLKNHSEVGAVAPKLLNPNLTVQYSVRNFPTYLTILWEVTGLAKLFPRHQVLGRWRMLYFDYDKPQEIEQPMTSCLLVRKTVFNEIGYFDERFPMYFNDVDFCLRLKKAGWKIYYWPSSYAIHNRGGSTRKVRCKMLFSMHKSFLDYLEKYDESHYFFLKRLVLYPLLLFSAVFRAVIEEIFK
jgi:GT2 family glycosyltransferase